MFENILVPVDLSDVSLAAARKAVEIACVDGAEVTLLHVIETIEGIEFNELTDFYKELDDKASEVMTAWCNELATKGVRLNSLVVYGQRGAEILRVAEQGGSDLIVATSHRVSPEKPGGGLGTISHQIGLLAGCSVLMLR